MDSYWQRCFYRGAPVTEELVWDLAQAALWNASTERRSANEEASYLLGQEIALSSLGSMCVKPSFFDLEPHKGFVRQYKKAARRSQRREAKQLLK
jgi:hypothetical protein